MHPILRASLVLAALLAVSSHPAVASPLDSLERYVDGLEAFGFTGQVLVARGDSVLLERAMGDADGKGRAVGPGTRFAAGSITKSVTASLIVRLAAEGRFSLDTPLARLLPRVPADKSSITPRQLLSHTSGLPEDAEGVFEKDTRADVLRATLATPLASVPGTRFGYSNAGFQLLAAIAERATGVAYARLADSLLFAPASQPNARSLSPRFECSCT